MAESLVMAGKRCRHSILSNHLGIIMEGWRKPWNPSSQSCHYPTECKARGLWVIVKNLKTFC